MEDNKKKKKEKNSPAEELYGWAQSFLFAIMLLVLVSSFVVRISGVSGGSMLDTLKDNDRVLVQILGYNYPEKGDIVVVTAPSFSSEPIVKRVIALEGDTVEIYSGGHVFVNGEELYEPYVSSLDFNGGQTLSYPYTVPDGHIFVMGDNREVSADSRYYSIGPIDIDNIIGKVFFRLWPMKSGSFGGI